jgi:hypothetical protein
VDQYLRYVDEYTRSGQKESFIENNHVLCSFSKQEMEALLQGSPLTLIEDAPNFEERSFVTVAKR